MVVWLVRLYGLTLYDYDINAYCNDINNQDPYAYAFAILSIWQVEMPAGTNTSIITGYPNGSCNPQGYTNRAEAVTFVMRAYAGLGQKK